MAAHPGTEAALLLILGEAVREGGEAWQADVLPEKDRFPALYGSRAGTVRPDVCTNLLGTGLPAEDQLWGES